jgi:hypothetical protein
MTSIATGKNDKGKYDVEGISSFKMFSSKLSCILTSGKPSPMSIHWDRSIAWQHFDQEQVSDGDLFCSPMELFPDM